VRTIIVLVEPSAVFGCRPGAQGIERFVPWMEVMVAQAYKPAAGGKQYNEKYRRGFLAHPVV